MKPGWDGLITATPDVLHGEARVAGTRIPVRAVMGCLASGWDEERIHNEYPTLPRGAVCAAAAYCADLLSHQLDLAARLAATDR